MNAITGVKRAKLDLVERHAVFVAKYCEGMSPRDAAITAGYSEKSAASQGSQLLHHPKIKAAIERHRAKVAKRVVSSQEKIIAELENMAFFNAQDISTVDEDGSLSIDFSSAERQHYSVVNKIKTKTRVLRDNKGNVIGTEKQSEVGLADKYRGLEMLGRHHGMFKTEEQRVVIDVADRLLSARARVGRGPIVEND